MMAMINAINFGSKISFYCFSGKVSAPILCQIMMFLYGSDDDTNCDDYDQNYNYDLWQSL